MPEDEDHTATAASGTLRRDILTELLFRSAHISISGLVLFLGWVAMASYAVAPTVVTGTLPGGLVIGDLLVGGMLLIGSMLIASDARLPRIGVGYLLLFFGVYIFLLLALPFLGLILIPQAEFNLILGDLRWICFLVIGIHFLWLYRRQLLTKFKNHVLIFLVVLALVNWPVLLAQLNMQIYGGRAPDFLGWWYPGGEGGYGNYGFHINRYAGAMIFASGFALLGGICFLAGLLARQLGWKEGFLVISGLIFVVASGSRALLSGLIVLLPILLIIPGTLRGSISSISSSRMTFMVLVAIVGIGVVFYMDIGRLIAEQRIQSIFYWLAGQTTFEEVSARGGERWFAPVEEARQWSALGTLVNPSHALSNLPPIDSYYLFLYAQAGPVLVSAFVLLMASLWGASIKIWVNDARSGAFPLAVAICLTLSTVTQNTMTSNAARAFLVIAVLSVVFYQSSRSLAR